jgi:hypothetical protein
MFKSTVDYDAAMVKILNCIIAGENTFKDIFEHYGALDTGDAIAECVSRGYIDGVIVTKTSGGQYEFSAGPNVRLTYRGLQFLENNCHYK